MSKLIDNDYCRSPSDDGIEVHLLEHRAAIFKLERRHDLEVLDLFGGVASAMSFYRTDNDVDAFLLKQMRVFQQLKRLADSCGRSDINAQFRPLRFLYHLQERLGL